eukprot:GFYU01001686.1.p1 GENE.GFYU01001686.1~~GFYU01001686.1.p1  ORF type:complete len:498 (+),score=53.26 GFYU01001686.1:327-1820(+)
MPPPKPLNPNDIFQYFHLPINEACKKIGICETLLKKFCRRNGIPRWPYRVFKSIDRMIHSLESDLRRGSGWDSKDTRENTEHRIQLLKQNKEFLLRNPSQLLPALQSGIYLTADLTTNPAFSSRPAFFCSAAKDMGTWPADPSPDVVPNSTLHHHELAPQATGPIQGSFYIAGAGTSDVNTLKSAGKGRKGKRPAGDESGGPGGYHMTVAKNENYSRFGASSSRNSDSFIPQESYAQAYDTKEIPISTTATSVHDTTQGRSSVHPYTMSTPTPQPHIYASLSHDRRSHMMYPGGSGMSPHYHMDEPRHDGLRMDRASMMTGYPPPSQMYTHPQYSHYDHPMNHQHLPRQRFDGSQPQMYMSPHHMNHPAMHPHHPQGLPHPASHPHPHSQRMRQPPGLDRHPNDYLMYYDYEGPGMYRSGMAPTDRAIEDPMGMSRRLAPPNSAFSLPHMEATRPVAMKPLVNYNKPPEMASAGDQIQTTTTSSAPQAVASTVKTEP